MVMVTLWWGLLIYNVAMVAFLAIYKTQRKARIALVGGWVEGMICALLIALAMGIIQL